MNNEIVDDLNSEYSCTNYNEMKWDSERSIFSENSLKESLKNQIPGSQFSGKNNMLYNSTYFINIKISGEEYQVNFHFSLLF